MLVRNLLSNQRLISGSVEQTVLEVARNDGGAQYRRRARIEGWAARWHFHRARFDEPCRRNGQERC